MPNLYQPYLYEQEHKVHYCVIEFFTTHLKFGNKNNKQQNKMASIIKHVLVSS